MAKKFYIEDNIDIPAIAFADVQPIGYSLVTDYEERKRLHTNRYKMNEQYGILYFHQFQAKMYINIVDGIYTTTEVITLENYLKVISDEIREGSWLTAKENLPTLALSGIFDQAMKDEIQSDINDYVTENY
jgi:hypothetical protein